ncbi:MAG: signal peptide peptidase SppA [Phycisphaeraceae bacterium]|nr:signal peptide peptidase SppA [Phycisphaeraceae bacterium]
MVGCLIGLLVIGAGGLMADGPAEVAPAEPENEASVVGWLVLRGNIGATPPPWSPTGDQQGSEMRSLIDQINHVAAHDQYQGLVVMLEHPMLSMDQVFELSEAIRRVREAGRTVVFFGESYTLPAYLLALSGDVIAIQEGGTVEMIGLSIEEMYLAGLLEKIGVQADFLQVGRFKGADEPLTRRMPSEAWDKNIDALLDDLYEQFVSEIADRRGLAAEEVEAVMADSLHLTAQQLVDRNVVDAVAARDMMKLMAEQFGNDFTWDGRLGAVDRRMVMNNPLQLFSQLMRPPGTVIQGPSLAVIHAVGPITSGQSDVDNLFSGRTVGSYTIGKALSDAVDEPEIRGILLRIDSPGGSALASEMMWQAVRKASKSKPVFVSLGDTAASGGYYLACAGTRIYATPSSVIGSIGVVGGKLVMGDLYEKIGVNVHRRSRGPLAGMFNSVEPFTPQQRQRLQQAFDQTYKQFVDRVKDGRGKRIDDIDEVTQGRLFTGRQALLNGLVDRLGGMETAMNDLAEMVGLDPEQYNVVYLPGPMSLHEFIERRLGPMATAPVAQINPWARLVPAVLGPRRWQQVQPVLTGLWQMQQEPILALMPTAIVIKPGR